MHAWGAGAALPQVQGRPASQQVWRPQGKRVMVWHLGVQIDEVGHSLPTWRLTRWYPACTLRRLRDVMVKDAAEAVTELFAEVAIEGAEEAGQTLWMRVSQVRRQGPLWGHSQNRQPGEQATRRACAFCATSSCAGAGESPGAAESRDVGERARGRGGRRLHQRDPHARRGL